jgi:hypothetical protein
MAKKKKAYLLCMHCGYQMFGKKKESFEQLHERFFKVHMVGFHVNRVADTIGLPSQKTVN